MTRAATEYEHADHDRDLRKHEVRIPTAVEIALVVKNSPLHVGADLIEQYARTKAAEQRLEAVAAGARP